MTLRRRLLFGLVLVGMVGLTACVTLATTAQLLHRRVVELSTAIESVEVADELAMLLATHYRSLDPVLRASAAPSIDQALTRAREHVQSAQEGELVARVDEEVHRYLASPSDTPLFETAYATTQRLRAINISQARVARDHARSSDALGRAIAIVSSSFIVLALALGFFWLRTSTFRPFVALERAMRRFAGGDYDARAVEAGGPDARAMASTFNQMALELGRSRERQLQYVASVVHDLRNPLSALQLALGILTSERPPPESRTRELLVLIQRQVVRMSSIVGDLLNAARIEAGELVLKREDVDLRPLATGIVDLFQRLAPGHILTLECPETLVIHCDRSRIEQVLNNLVSNAIKYSPTGERVDVQVRSVEDGCKIDVRDQGVGIAPEERERIFDPFFRGTAAHEEAVGAGLGLFATRRIVEAHGGRIDVTSRVGEGSVFSVFLPKTTKQARVAPETETETETETDAHVREPERELALSRAQ